MIIIEGPDNAGKTTLVQQLQAELKLPTIRAGKRPTCQNDIINYHNWAGACPLHAIMDRHPAISEYIYGPILRAHTLSSAEIVLHSLQGNFTIICLPSFTTVAYNYGSRPQLEGTKENLLRIYNAYTQLANDFLVNCIYNYQNAHAITALVTQLTHYLSRTR